MGKRKSTSLEKEMNKRFKKLKEDLLRNSSHRRRVLPVSSSSDSDSEPHSIEVPNEESLPQQGRAHTPLTTRAHTPLTPRVHTPPTPRASPRRSRSRQRRTSRRVLHTASRSPRGGLHASPVCLLSPARRSSTSPASIEGPSTLNIAAAADVHREPEPDKSSEIQLDDEILQLLGDAPKTDVTLGNPIHKDIANRWQDVLSKGLTKDVRDTLLQEYLVPSNCELLLAPTLNPEAKAAISEMMVKRDAALMYTQKQLGIAISALAVATNLIVSKESSTQNILKPISDACRLLCDIHRYETQNRRKFVISSINTSLKDALLESTRDKFLFGENLSERLKAAKNIQRTGDDLKYVTRKTFSKANFANKSQNRSRLNWKPQHRKTNNRPSNDNVRYRSNQRAQQQPRGSGSAGQQQQQQPPRSPPRRTQPQQRR